MKSLCVLNCGLETNKQYEDDLSSVFFWELNSQWKHPSFIGTLRGRLSATAVYLLLPFYIFCECPFKGLHHPLCSFFFPRHISQCSAFSAQRQVVNSPVYNTATSWSTIPSPSVKPTHLSVACSVCHDTWWHPSCPCDQIMALTQTASL